MSKREKFTAASKEKSSEIAARFAEIESRGRQLMALELLEPDPDQPRSEFDADGMARLVDSIRDRGILQPIIVRKVGEKYRIIAGERRWQAAKILKLEYVPTDIKEIQRPEEILDLQLVENLHREDLNDYERTVALLRLMELRTQMSQELILKDIVRRYIDNTVKTDLSPVIDGVLGMFGITLSTFYRHHLKILRMSPEILEAIKENRLDYTIAALIDGIKDLELRREVFTLVLREQLSFRQLQDLISTKKTRASHPPADVRKLQRSLTGIKKKLPDLKPEVQTWVSDQIKRIQEVIKDGRILTDDG
jgi:ParB family transcriptional regulator, chromosome partitioning protein